MFAAAIDGLGTVLLEVREYSLGHINLFSHRMMKVSHPVLSVVNKHRIPWLVLQWVVTSVPQRCFTVAVGHVTVQFLTVNGDNGTQSKMPRTVNGAKRCTVPSTVQLMLILTTFPVSYLILII